MPAWLHYIGYAPTIAATGFHPLDDARHLRGVVGANAALTRLVAHHSGAPLEAGERGLGEVLVEEFGPEPDNLLLQALTAADMTSPVGDPVLPEHRIQEILDRYGPGRRCIEPWRARRRTYGPLPRASTPDGRPLHRRAGQA